MTYTTSKESLGRLPWVLLGVAATLALALFAINQHAARASDSIIHVKVGTAVPAWQPSPGWATAAAPERIAGVALSIPRFPPFSEQDALALFPLNNVEMVDAYCGKLYKPNLSWVNEFAEYPDKRIRWITNSRSMREDSEPRVARPALRVLVAGDSHTDGVCQNSESFANLTETALRKRAETENRGSGLTFDPGSIEVLNAGKGSHTFYNYLGVLERNLDLRPDVFVVNVYGGNDFEEALAIWHFYNNQGRRPGGTEKYVAEVNAAMLVNLPAMAQGINSVKYMYACPGQKLTALKAAAEVFGEIQALCRERGIRLLVMYLPPRQDVEPDNPQLKIPELLKALNLEPAALASTNELANLLLAKLAEMGVETIDLRPPFQASKRSLYWNTDWHINLLGHQLIARQLFAALSARR